MRIIPTPPPCPPRQPITIEFTPEEQDALKTIVGTYTGPPNKVHDFLDLLWAALDRNGAQLLRYTGGMVQFEVEE